nr:hypothetical protein [Legionella jordanis]
MVINPLLTHCFLQPGLRLRLIRATLALWWDNEHAYLLQLSAGANNSIEDFKEIFRQLIDSKCV